MSNVRIGIQTRCLRQPLKRALETAARLGADGVEIDAVNELPPDGMSRTGIRQFRKLLDDLRLRVSAVAFPTRHGYDEPEGLERRVLGTQAAMMLAYDLGAEVVVNRIGNVPEDPHDPRYSRLLESLTALGVYSERAGARLALQLGRESPAIVAHLLAALPEATIGVDLHPASLIFHGHSPREAVAELGRYVLHMHACDAVRDLAAGRASEVALGRGTADLPALLGQLTEFNYHGWVTIERRDAADPVEEIGNAVAYLRSL